MSQARHLASLFALVALTACAPPPPAKPPVPRHLLFITVDTLRADHMSLYGYPRKTTPHLDELAAKGVTFDRAISQWPKTGTSFASMFTGQYPQTTGLTHKAALHIPDAYLTLPEWLAEGGFTTVAVVSNGVLSEDMGWNAGFDEYLETWDTDEEVSENPRAYRKWIHAGRVNELALPLLDRHRADEHLFAWIHYSDPHAPYFLQDGVENPFLDDPYYQGDEKADLADAHTALGDHRDLKYYVAQYDANVLYADRHIGELLAHVEKLGILDETVVVVTSDHGESLGEHGYFFGHGRLPYNDGVHVPLVVSYPPALPSGRRVAQVVELLDLYPTLLEWLLPERAVPGLEGESLLGLLRGDVPEEASHLAFSQAGGGSPLTHFRSVQDESTKLIYHPRLVLKHREIPPRWELYRLDEDPGETSNLAAAEPSDEARRLHRELRAFMKGGEWIRRPREEIDAQSEEIQKALRALGYTE